MGENPHHRSQTWATFLKYRAGDIWACDFTVACDLFFLPWFVFMMMELTTRRIAHIAITQSSTDELTAQQLRETTAWGSTPQHLSFAIMTANQTGTFRL